MRPSDAEIQSDLKNETGSNCTVYVQLGEYSHKFETDPNRALQVYQGLLNISDLLAVHYPTYHKATYKKRTSDFNASRQVVHSNGLSVRNMYCSLNDFKRRAACGFISYSSPTMVSV